jgi:hypothetical protein
MVIGDIRIVLNISSLCKAEERGDAVAPLIDNNAADGDIGSAVSLNVNVSVH